MQNSDSSNASAGTSETSAQDPDLERSSMIRAVASDILGVLVFVAVGRNNHDQGSAISGIIAVAAPFLIALGLGWLIATKRRMQPTTLQFGAVVWAVTLIVGMVLRRVVFDRGTATPFVIVATIFLAVVLLGWRALGQFRRGR